MNYYEQKTAEAVALLKSTLALPMPDSYDIGCVDFFDPWSLFPALYGSYSGDFDECAIDVLTEIRDGRKVRDDLGAEMFREMLCTSGLCTYGTSPRVCFPDRGFGELLPDLIEKWKQYSAVQWSPRP